MPAVPLRAVPGFVDVAGNPLPATLQAALKDIGAGMVGQPANSAAVAQLCGDAATALADAGFIAAVKLPADAADQLANGALNLRVIAAQITQIRVRGAPGRLRSRLNELLGRLDDRQVLNVQDAERILLLANDMPGTVVNMELRPDPSGKPGAVIADIQLQRDKGNLVANVQNYGASQIGRWSGLLRGEVYDLTGLADRTFASVLSSSDARGLVVVQGGHEFGVGNDGLRLGMSGTFAKTRPTLPNAAVGFNLASESYLFTLSATYPLVRSQGANARLGVGLDYVDQITTAINQQINRDQIRTGWVRLDGDVSPRALSGGSALPWRLSGFLELRQGLGIFAATKTGGNGGSVLPTRFEGNARAFVARGGFAAEVRSYIDRNKSWAATLATDVRGQWANDPLLAFDEFAVGNLTMGRGYDPGATAGDRMVGVSTEFRIGQPVPKSRRAAAFELLGFYDHVELWNLDSNNFERQRRLSSVGGGVRLTWGNHARLDLVYAQPLDKNLAIDLQKPGGRLLVSLTVRALPWR
jgi:hemolysin activation/secretion protein